MANLEYRFVQVEERNEIERMADEINIAAQEGWEVVFLTPKYGKPAFYALMKRGVFKRQMGGLPQFDRE